MVVVAISQGGEVGNRSLIALAQFIVDVDRADRVTEAERGLIVQSERYDDRRLEGPEVASVAQTSVLTVSATN